MDNALKAWQEKYKPVDTAQKEKAQTALEQWKQRYSPATAPEQPEPKAAAASAFLAAANVGETAKETLRNKETGKLLKNAIGTAEQEVVRSGGTRESEEFLTRRKDAYDQWKKEQIGKVSDLWAQYADEHAKFSFARVDSQKGKEKMERMATLRDQLKLHLGIDDEQLDDILDTYKLTPVEELNYLAGKVLTGGAGSAQGGAQMLHKLFYDDLAILGSLVDTTTGGRTNAEEKLQETADRSFDIDVFGADKLREYNEQLYADKYIPKTTRFFGGLAESAGGMLPAIATGNAAGMLGLSAKAAQALNYLSFGSGAAGNAAKQALEEGADMRDAVQYGLYSGMLEVLSESMFAGIAGMNESALMDDILDKLSKNGTLRFLMDTLGEGVEEGVVAFLEPYIRRATIDPEAAPATAREILEAAASGVALSAIMNGAAVATSGPAAVFGSQKGTQEQMILQDKYGRVEESTVKDVLRKPPVTKEQEKADVQPAAPQEEEIPKMELAGPEAFEPASKTEQKPTEELPKMELVGPEAFEPAPKTERQATEEIPKMELAGPEMFETEKTNAAGEAQREKARMIGDMLEGSERTRYSPRELGVEQGGNAALVTLLTDQQVKQVGLEDATRIAEEAGYTPVFYSGLMVMEDGQISRWAKSGKRLYIQADSAVQSAAEIAEAAVKASGGSAVIIRPAAENTKTATADIPTGKQATYFGANAGLVKNNNWKAANLSSKTSRQLEALGKVTGTRIRFVPQIIDEKGNEANARYLNGEILLSLKADDPVMVSAIHEAVHRLRETNAEAYNALAAFVRENMSEKAFQSVLDKTEERYSGESPDSITEEVVADGLGRVLADSNVMEQFVQDNRNAAQKLADILRDIVNSIRRALQHQNLELTAEQRADFTELEQQMSAAERALSQALKRADQITQARKETKNAVTEGGVAKSSKKLGGYANIQVNVPAEVNYFGITSINDYVGVQKAVYKKLQETEFFDKDTKRRTVENADTGIVVEIGRDGINETFGPGKRYALLPAELKQLKIATVRYLPEIIKYGEVIESDAPNYHNAKSNLTYTYIQHPITAGKNTLYVQVDIRQSRQTNKFWVHSIYVNTKKDQVLDANADKSGSAINKDLILNETITPPSKIVKGDDDEAKNSLKYSRKETASEEKELAHRLIKAHKSNLKYKEIEENILLLKNRIKEYGIDVQAERQATDIATKLVESARKEVPDKYRKLRKLLRNTGITLDKAYEKDLDGYSSLQEFRKAHWNRLKLVNDGLEINDFYNDLAAKYPDLFDTNTYTTPVEQLLHISEVLEQTKPTYVNPYAGNEANVVETVAEEILKDVESLIESQRLQGTLSEPDADSTEETVRDQILNNSMETTDELVSSLSKASEAIALRHVAPEQLAKVINTNQAEQETAAKDLALIKLKVKIVNSVGIYHNVDQMLANARAHKTLVRERRKYEERMKATAKEKNFARGIADGIYNISEINPAWDRKVIEALSEWYMAERNFGELYITQVKHAVKRDVDEATDAIFDGIDDSKVDHALVLNHRTATRNMTKMFGAEKGAQINRWLFEPVTQNEAERIRFINRQFDKVRTFEDQQGKQRPLNKQERELVQRVIEYRVAAEAVEKLKNAKDIKDAAYNVMRGEDIGDLGLEFGLTFEEQTLTRNYVKWLEVKDMLETADSTIIYNAADTYAELFDTYYDAINEFLAAHGYQPIGFIKGYVPHLQPEKNQNMLQKTLQSMGINVDAVSIPTSIAGLTGDYKPNKKWNPYFLHRNSGVTQYDIVEAFESYVANMADVLYHTDDIMRIRSAVRYFRREYSPEEIRSAIDWAESLRNFSHDDKVSFLLDEGVISSPKISKEDAKESLAEFIEKQYGRIEETHKYNNLVTWLDNYANILAGKQSVADRGSEYTLGRKILNVGNKVTRVFSRANVAGNISSALNNSAQLPVILAENGIKNSTAAFWDVVSGKLRKAAWAEESDFLTGKRGVNFIVTTPGEMTLNVFYKPMEWVDSLLSTMAVRGAYLRGIQQGMNHEAAMRFADKYAAEVMADRSKGAKPLAFDAKNPLSAMVHLFQVEALNSWEHIAQDMPRDIKRIAADRGKKKAAAALAGVLTKMLVYAFIMNRLAEKLYGGTPAMFDIFGLTANFIASGEGLSTNEFLEAMIDKVLLELFGETLFDEEDEWSLMRENEFDFGAGLEDLTYNISNEIPFVRNLSALLGLGDETLPLPDVVTPAKDVFAGIKDRDVLAALDAAVKGLGEIIPGGRQAVKTYTGIQTAARGGKMFGFGENKKLQYPVSRTPGKVAKAVIFGPSALDSAQSYYASGNKTLTAKETVAWELLVDNGVDEEEAYEVIYATKGEDVKEIDAMQIMSAPDDWDDALKYEAMKTMVSDATGYKLDVLQEYGVSADQYVTLRSAMLDEAEARIAELPEEERPETARISQEDAAKVLKAASGIDKNTKAIIWQMIDAGWSYKSNPYSTTSGKAAKARHDQIKSEAEEIPKMELAGLD